MAAHFYVKCIERDSMGNYFSLCHVLHRSVEGLRAVCRGTLTPTAG